MESYHMEFNYDPDSLDAASSLALMATFDDDDEDSEEIEMHLIDMEEVPTESVEQVVTEKQFDVGILTTEQKVVVNEMFDEHKNLFANDLSELKQTNLVKHVINTGDALPVRKTLYSMTPEKQEFLRKELDMLMNKGLIRESYSPWACSPLIVPKKGPKKWRFCVDYRPVNKVTKKDAYPLPRIDEMLETFGGAKWFSSLDLFSGYWQVAMDEKDGEKTAFVTKWGTYEFNVMPFGLCNTPAMFQRLMNKVLRDCIGKFVVVYLDDVTVYSTTFEEHTQHLKIVFEAV